MLCCRESIVSFSPSTVKCWVLGFHPALWRLLSSMCLYIQHLAALWRKNRLAQGRQLERQKGWIFSRTTIEIPAIKLLATACHCGVLQRCSFPRQSLNWTLCSNTYRYHSRAMKRTWQRWVLRALWTCSFSDHRCRIREEHAYCQAFMKYLSLVFFNLIFGIFLLLSVSRNYKSYHSVWIYMVFALALEQMYLYSANGWL